jgi:hypothetical protein
MNAKWHDANPMPGKPTVQQRVRWHRAHQKHCGCRPVPPSLLPLMGRDETKPSRPRSRVK